MRRLVRFAVVLLLLVLSAAVSARPGLTEPQVLGFIASIEATEAFSAAADRPGLSASAAAKSLRSTTNPLTTAVIRLRGQDAHDDLREIIRYHGFGSPEGWALVGDRVLHAFQALQMEREASTLHGEMQQSLREIDRNPNLSPEQRRMMRDLLSKTLSDMQIVMRAPQADIEAVRPHLARLRRAIER